MICHNYEEEILSEVSVPSWLRALYFRQVLNSSHYMPSYLLVLNKCLSSIFCTVRYLNTGRCKFRSGRDFFYVTELKQCLKLICYICCVSRTEKVSFLKSFFNFLLHLRYCNIILERGKLVCSCGSGVVVCQNSGRLFGANKKTELRSPFHYVIKDGC
jgi:hypothetical protein